jgi:hypothetical protein
MFYVRVLVQGNLHFNISGFNVFSNPVFSDIQPIISGVKFSTFYSFLVFGLQIKLSPKKTFNGAFNLYEIWEQIQHEKLAFPHLQNS